MPTNATGSANLTYGDFSHSESFRITLDAYADTTAGKVKNYNSCDRRVEDVDTEISTGDIAQANIGLTIFKNMNDFGDLHVDINFSSFAADLIIPPGGVNMIHPATGTDKPHIKCPIAGKTGRGVASATSAGLVTFDGAEDVGTAYIASTANPASGDDFIIKISKGTSPATGVIYELDGVTIKDMSGTWGATTEVELTYFVDCRCIVTEV